MSAGRTVPLRRRCLACGTLNVLRLRGRALRPGTALTFRCGKCGEEAAAFTPGDPDRDEIMETFDRVTRLFGEFLHDHGREA